MYVTACKDEIGTLKDAQIFKPLISACCISLALLKCEYCPMDKAVDNYLIYH